MKTIYVMYCDRHGEFDAVFDESGNYLHGWYNNDASWRNEYFNPLMRELGYDFVDISPEEKPWWYRKACRALDIDTRVYNFEE